MKKLQSIDGSGERSPAAVTVLVGSIPDCKPSPRIKTGV
jgi:hypothetical protein